MNLKSILLLSALAVAGSANAVVLANFGFEVVTPADQTDTASSASYAADSGIFAATSRVSSVHASAATDYTTPAGNGSDNSFSSNTFTVGDYFQFTTSTIGFQDLAITFDQTGSNTGPRDFKFSYSTNGTTFTDAGTYSITNDAWLPTTVNPISGKSFNLSSISALNNLANVTFRIVDTSTAAINGSTVAVAGTGRIDNFVVNGTAQAVPEPASMAALGLGALGLLRRRRSAK